MRSKITSLKPLFLRRFGAAPSASNGNPNFFRRNPVLTSFITGGLLWGSGDLLAQTLEKGAVSLDVDKKRLAGTMIHGSVVAGAGGYYWYSFLDRFVHGNLRLVSGTLRFVLTKLAFEFSIFHPITLMCYWWIVGRCEGHGIDQIIKELKSDFLMTWFGDGMLWSPLDLLLFWKVPVHLQVMVINCGSLIEAIALSYIHKNGINDKISENKTSVNLYHSIFTTSIEEAIGLNTVKDVGARASMQFDQLDSDKNGWLTIDELQHCPLLPGIKDNAVNQVVLKLLMAKATVEKVAEKNCISKNEYIRLISKMHETGYRQSFIIDVVIAIYDTNNDGQIDIKELESIIRIYLNMDVDPQTLDSIMRKYDMNKDGRLNKNEMKQVIFTHFKK
jgi:Ca2+-binding EF-hand superfamily protein